MAANMYRVGDYVFFETSSTSPYQIRRIEELSKTPNGNVEAKVMCFYRRRDISSSLIMLADKHQSALEEEQELTGLDGSMTDMISEKHRHQLKHRELFLSRQVETLPATHIRGKCTVTLLNETESLLSYLNKEDTFFYALVYDPTQKTLLADRGEIRVGSKFQAEVITKLVENADAEGRTFEDLETLVWTPNHSLTDRQIDQFLVIARSVGTFARALDCTSSVKQPSLHMSAAAASRDVTLFHAMDILHKHGYDVANAICSLVPSSGPVLCRDEMEEWSASEANLFEEALEKYGKDFNDIRQDFLPWKSLKNIIEYYYMWKTTDRYVQQKRVKAVEAESKLKQVYIPNYNKPNPAAINVVSKSGAAGMLNGSSGGTCGSGISGVLSGTAMGGGGSGSAGDQQASGGKACESCYATQSGSQWYAWGPMHMQCRLCSACWSYWKKYGGLKMPTRLERLAAHMAAHRPHRCTIAGCGKEFKLKAHLARHCANAHNLTIRPPGSPRPIMKTRAAFYLCTGLLTRLSRRLCRDLLRPRRLSRNPFQPVNGVAIKQESQVRSQDKSPEELRDNLLAKARSKSRGKVVDVSYRLGNPDHSTPEWLIAMDKSKLPQPEMLTFPPPPRGEDGRLLVDFMLNREKPEAVERYLMPGINSVLPNILRKRGYDEQSDGLLGPPPSKRPMRPGIGPGSGGSVGACAGSVVGIGGIGGIGSSGGMGKPSQDIFAARQLLPRGTVLNHLNGRAKLATINKLGRKQVLSWVDAPDDVYFQATDTTRKIRKQLAVGDLRKAARRPWRKLNVKFPATAPSSEVVILD